LDTQATRLIEQLGKDGVELWVDGDQLRYRVARGTLTAERKALIRASRTEIMGVLSARQSDGITPPQVRGAESVWPPSDPQLGIALNNDTFNSELAFYWQGDVDAPAFEAALRKLMQRHGILRTHYFTDDAQEVWAVTAREFTVPLTALNLTSETPEAAQAAVYAARQELVERRFDIHVGPLVRFLLARLPGGNALFSAVFQHSIYDGASTPVFISELSALYLAEMSGTDAALPPLPMQYCDFARERYRWLSSEQVQPHLAYWRNKLAGARTIFWLPVDRKTPVGDTAALPLIRGHVGADAARALREIANREQCTMFVVTVTALCIVLARWSGRSDVSTWVCHAGRSRPELQRLIGYFVSFWPLRTSLPDDLTFIEALRGVREAYREALPHSEVTVKRLRPELEKIREGAFYPGTVFNFIPKVDSPSLAMPSAVSRPPEIPDHGRLGGSSTLAIVFNAWESEDRIQWEIKHAAHLFEEATIEQMSGCFARVLSAAADGRNPRIGDLVPRVPGCNFSTS
jgi:hypothetical protein